VLDAINRVCAQLYLKTGEKKMIASYTDKGYNLACGCDEEGNVWEARYSGDEYHLFKNGRHEATMSNQANILILFSQVLRQEKK